MPEVKLTQWDVKHKQDKPFMAFGSMMNAYGQLNHSKGMSIDNFLKVADAIFAKASKYAENTLMVVQQVKGQKKQLDIPIKE